MLMNTQPVLIEVSLKVMNADGSLAVVLSPWHAEVYPINTSLPSFVVNVAAE
jgi:hypothetical protein